MTHPAPTSPSMTAPVGAILVSAGILLLGGTLPAPLYLIWQKQIYFPEIVLTLVFGIYFLAAVVAPPPFLAACPPRSEGGLSC